MKKVFLHWMMSLWPSACAFCWAAVEAETGPWQSALRFGRPRADPAPDMAEVNMSHEERSGLCGQKNANKVVQSQLIGMATVPSSVFAVPD